MIAPFAGLIAVLSLLVPSEFVFPFAGHRTGSAAERSCTAGDIPHRHSASAPAKRKPATVRIVTFGP